MQIFMNPYGRCLSKDKEKKKKALYRTEGIICCHFVCAYIWLCTGLYWCKISLDEHEVNG